MYIYIYIYVQNIFHFLNTLINVEIVYYSLHRTVSGSISVFELVLILFLDSVFFTSQYYDRYYGSFKVTLEFQYCFYYMRFLLLFL